MILWAFDIEKGRDKDGKVITPDIDDFHDEGVVVWVQFLNPSEQDADFHFLTRMDSAPTPFPCEFRVRGPEVIPMLTRSQAESTNDD